MKRTIGMIADDLTGANDSGVQLAKYGYSTSVLFKVPETNDPLDDAIVIDTNARALERDAAVKVVKQASEYIKACDYEYIYKKIDSTLRGHISSEMEAMVQVFHPTFIIIAPAFPTYGRTTAQGVHYVNGIELAKTEVNTDPTHPVFTSNIKELMKEDIKEEMGIIDLGDIENGNIANKLTSYEAKQIRYIICDAQTEKDLEKIVTSVTSITNKIIWVGSAGLAAALAKNIQSTNKEITKDMLAPKHVITVCGSVSDISQEQVAYAKNQPDVAAIKVDTPAIFTEEWQRIKENYLEQITLAFQNGEKVILYASADELVMEAIQQIKESKELSNSYIAQAISEALGEIILELSHIFKDKLGYILTGGDTAKSISLKLGATGVKVIQEVEAGIPTGNLISKEEQVIVTKAGGFGQKESIYKAMQYIKEEQ